VTRLVVVGDALLDIDVVGVARRLSPDAPVPVLDDIVEHPRPGGAALAAVMAANDGHDVTLVTALGGDDGGRRLHGLLAGVTVVALPYTGPTPVKRRVRSAGQSLVRLDSGSEPGEVTHLPDAVATALSRADCVLVSDYGRGVSALPALRDLLQSLPASVPLVWDPHPRGADPVPGCHLVTPNRSEAAAFAQRPEPSLTTAGSHLADTQADAVALVHGWRARAVAVTLGSRGALLTYGSGAPSVSPAPSVHCVDPCGAGDRFAVTAALELARDRLPSEAVAAAVLSASAYVAHGGPAGLFASSSPQADGAPGAAAGLLPAADVSALLDGVRAGGGTVVAAGGCFDLLHPGHIATLQSARSLGDCLVVCLNSDASVRRLKGPQRPLVRQADRARVLSALECVDAVVVFDEDTPAQILDRLRPHIWVKGGDYAGVDVPEAAVLERWGGQVVTLSYLPGHSTSQLASAAAGSNPTVVHEIEEMQP
jgi:rfaE bifunctional protein nucleotidyltransferase chain/domain/rfaE bifunctional protein kinase chain/domain